MTVLIVDDQKSVTDGILAGVHWEALDNPNVLTANSAEQARAYFQKSRIDIIVCDIEMPVENGLSLFAWVKKHYPETEGLFLTSHAVFDYAQEAIRLNCYRYLLQPIGYKELEQNLMELIREIYRRQEEAGFAQIGSELLEDRETLVRHFWSNLLLTRTGKDQAPVERDTLLLGIPVNFQTNYRTMLITVCGEKTSLARWEGQRAAHKVAELLALCGEAARKDINSCTILLDNTHLILVHRDASRNYFEQFIWQWIHVCNQSLQIAVSCCVGRPRKLLSLWEDTDALLELAGTLTAECTLAWLEENAAADIQPREFHETRQILDEQETWIRLFSSGDAAGLGSLFHQQLQNLPANDIDSLFLLHQTIFQSFFSSLHLRSLSVRDIYRNPEYLQIYIRSYRSKENLSAWFSVLLNYNKTLPAAKSEPEHIIVEQLRNYIAQHLEHELTRRELADQVYLSESYVSHLWKKETGTSLNDYVTEQKIAEARRLLQTTRLPISLIASKVGYSNFAYFSKVFKKVTEKTPNEFRKGNTQARGTN